MLGIWAAILLMGAHVGSTCWAKEQSGTLSNSGRHLDLAARSGADGGIAGPQLSLVQGLPARRHRKRAERTNGTARGERADRAAAKSRVSGGGGFDGDSNQSEQPPHPVILLGPWGDQALLGIYFVGQRPLHRNLELLFYLNALPCSNGAGFAPRVSWLAEAPEPSFSEVTWRST